MPGYLTAKRDLDQSWIGTISEHHIEHVINKNHAAGLLFIDCILDKENNREKANQKYRNCNSNQDNALGPCQSGKIHIEEYCGADYHYCHSNK
jgi:hypothetical protein